MIFNFRVLRNEREQFESRINDGFEARKYVQVKIPARFKDKRVGLREMEKFSTAQNKSEGS